MFSRIRSKNLIRDVCRRYFRLEESFIEAYKSKVPSFGYNGLGELVYLRTYSRIKASGTREQWYETIERVVNGCFTLKERHFKVSEIPFDEQHNQVLAQEMYSLMFEMKILPPGRGLWAMGTELTENRSLFTALNNCGFVSTLSTDSDVSFSEPFCFLMDSCMLGVGIGFDTKGAGTQKVYLPEKEYV